MRNVIALAGLAVMAAAVVMGDGGHPYHYETSAGWGDHHHNALVSSRQSPNPLRSRQALAALLTPGVLTAIASFAGAIGVGTVQTTAVNNRVDETNRRVGTNENDIKKSKADIKTLTDNSCTKTTCNDIKSTADGACTTAKCMAIETAATALTTRVMAAETEAATLKNTFVKDTCNKVKTILVISDPSPPTDMAADGKVDPATLSPATDGVAKNLGGGSTDGNDYTITKAIIPNGKTSLTASVPAGNGLAIIEDAAKSIHSEAGGSDGQDTLALSLTDFNLFRLRVVSAFNQLENKVREVTKLVDDLTCPT